MKIDYVYEDALRQIMGSGIDRGDRTGTGTRSLFGLQMRWDLNEGFPLVTTKQVFTKSTIDELLWFISGGTNTDGLMESTKKWWAPWARADGELGPIYGEQFRASAWWHDVTPMIFQPPAIEKKEGLAFGVGDLGSYRLPSGPSGPGEHGDVTMLKTVWREMLRRCYHDKCKSYAGYGGKGVHVDPEWLLFDNFYRDAKLLPGWFMKKEYPDDMSLDKDIKLASNRYSRQTCIWAGREEQGFNLSNSNPFSALNPDGERVIFASIGEMNRQTSANVSAVHRCLTGKLQTHHGWSKFTYLQMEDGKVRRFRRVDQIKQLIASLKHNPEGRRHVINLWSTPAMDVAELPCCHGSLIQFWVAENKLSCQMYQRSADMLIGVPVNIASYSLLTHMVAQQCDLGVGEFIWTGGDCHVYSNHFDQVRLQLGREAYPRPTLELNKAASIFEYQLSDVAFKNYQHHPAIKGEVAV